MTMTLAIGAISESQPNLSTLGARRCLAPLPKWRILTAGVPGRLAGVRMLHEPVVRRHPIRVLGGRGRA